MVSFGDVFRIVPLTTVTEEQLDLALALVEEALRARSGTMPLYAQEDNLTQLVMAVKAKL